jgi:type III pantothenate kinase
VPPLGAIPVVRASAVSTPAHEWLRLHTADLTQGLRFLSERSELVEAWGQSMAEVLSSGGRLLAVGNGGSAAEAQHLTAELVGRFLEDRRPFSALSLSAETSSLTAILNDYGVEEVFARQVEAHGRPGDILLALSTSGRSPNVLAAAKRAHDVGLTVWAMTGPEPNPLAGTADAVLAVPAASTAAIQEVHLVAVHAICAAMDRVLETSAEPASGSGTTPGDAEGQAQVPA